MRRTEAKPMTPCRRGYWRLPLAKAHRAAGSHDQGRDAGNRPAAPGQRYALFNTHSGDIQMPANVLPTNSRLFPVFTHAPHGATKRPVSHPGMACYGLPNGTFGKPKRHLSATRRMAAGWMGWQSGGTETPDGNGHCPTAAQPDGGRRAGITTFGEMQTKKKLKSKTL